MFFFFIIEKLAWRWSTLVIVFQWNSMRRGNAHERWKKEVRAHTAIMHFLRNINRTEQKPIYFYPYQVLACLFIYLFIYRFI